MTNRELAKELRAHANQLQHKAQNLFRIRAYRRAAQTIEEWRQPLSELYQQHGRRGLEDLPDIGSHLAFALESLLSTGKLHSLTPDIPHNEPDRILTRLPGIGPKLAHRLHTALGVSTIDQLTEAVRQGRLQNAGLNSKQSKAILEGLEVQCEQRTFPEFVEEEPEISELLEIDREYRDSQSIDNVEKVDLQWQPIFRRERNGWKFRARPCKLSVAYRMNRVQDWVIVYFDNGITSGERIVYTETEGEFCHRRMVRGRERESRMYHEGKTFASA